MCEIHVMGIDYESVVDGEGVRTVIFFSGCVHNCDGCHNPESHDFLGGEIFSREMQEEIFSHVENSPYIDGITLSGGDCFFNPKLVIGFVKEFKKRFPKKTVWGYTGFTLEEILLDSRRRKLFELCDYVVDGKFEKEKKGFNLVFKGSSNQRIINVRESLKAGRVVQYKQ